MKLKLRHPVMASICLVSALFLTSAAVAGQRGTGYDRPFNLGHKAGTKCDFVFERHPLIDGKQFKVVDTFVDDGSYYGNRLFHNGDDMASLKPLHECDATVVAINKDRLPLGTILRITNPKNGEWVLAVVQDRTADHVWRPDLARGAFETLKGDDKPAEGVLKNLKYEILKPIG